MVVGSRLSTILSFMKAPAGARERGGREKTRNTVILSEAKNPSSVFACASIEERFFASLRMTSQTIFRGPEKCVRADPGFACVLRSYVTRSALLRFRPQDALIFLGD